MADQHRRRAGGYGSSAGAAYGIVAGSLRSPNALYGLPFGAAVFAGRLHRPPGRPGLYKQICGGTDARDPLAIDLSAHLAYGAGTATAFWLLATVG